jgi:hypothetical protein
VVVLVVEVVLVVLTAARVTGATATPSVPPSLPWYTNAEADTAAMATASPAPSTQRLFRIDPMGLPSAPTGRPLTPGPAPAVALILR